MEVLSHRQREILHFVGLCSRGPIMPPPPGLTTLIQELIDVGLLSVAKTRCRLTEIGRTALIKQPYEPRPGDLLDPASDGPQDD